MQLVYKIILVPVFFLTLLCSVTSFQLSKKDVRKATQTMLGLHVEYKDFSPMLARRALKLCVETKRDFSGRYQ